MRTLRPLALLVLAMTATASVGPAGAQCRLCDQPETVQSGDRKADDNLQLQIETNLSFDHLVLAGTGPGAVTIRPNGSSGTEGIVAAIGPRAMVGTVLVHGDPGRAVRVDMPRRIELHSLTGRRLTLDDVSSDLPAGARLDAAGNLSFRFGGRLLVSGDTDGQYRGDLAITVEYL